MHFAKLARALLVRTREAEGQALAEYGLILAFVAIAAVAAMVALGGVISTPFTDFIEAAGLGGD